MHNSVTDKLSFNNSQKEYIIIDSPKKKVKLDEQEDLLAKELKDFRNSETHKQQTIIYYYLFQLLINYGHKYNKFPLDYMYLLKQKVDIMENSIKQDNIQRDLFYQLNLDIQEFIEQEEPLKQVENILMEDKQCFIAQLNITTQEFQANNEKLFQELQNNGLFKFSKQDQHLICESLLEIADKSFYQLEIIQIIEQIVQDLQIQEEQKTYIDIYIFYIAGDYCNALKFLSQARVDIKQTSKYLFLKGLVYYFVTRESQCYFDEALEITPQDVNIKIQKGICLQFEKSYQKAINEFEDCLKIDNKKAEVYFLKGICHFWLNKEEDYIEALRLFELGLILKPNFRFGELLKYYALQKLEMKQDEQILLEKLNQYHQNYDIYVINYIIGIASQFLNELRCVFSESLKHIQSKEIRNIQKLIIIMNFYQINFLSPQKLEQIINRIEEPHNQKPPVFIKETQQEFGSSSIVLQIPQLNSRNNGILNYYQRQQQSFFCQNCGILNLLSKQQFKQ